MKNHKNQLRLKLKRTAFTLVEMLIVGAIIVILAGLTLLATNAAATAAKETKTRATIQKLDTAMQQIFETYENKFIALQNTVDDVYELTNDMRQKIALHYARDLVRMEMPQAWTEVYHSANPSEMLGSITAQINGANYTNPSSPLLDYYWAEYKKAKKCLSEANKPNEEPGRAALLFLIIQNLNPEALEAFHESEVADTDGDGLLEFVDAWGKPIYFLRWTPAFPGSDLQPDVLALCEPKYVPRTDMGTNEKWWTNRYTGTTDAARQPLLKAREQAQYLHPDPFDEQKYTISWFLYPLIYSAGADGKYDLISEELDPVNKEPKSPTIGAAGILDPFAFPMGMPGDADGNGALNHFDNIHNHQWYRSY